MLQTLKNTPTRLRDAAKLPGQAFAGAKYAFGLLFSQNDDHLAAEIAKNTTPREASFRHISFTFAAISLSALVARADGKVSQAEYLAFRDSFPLTGGVCGKIRELFTLACDSDTPYEHHVIQVKYLFAGQKELFISLLDRLFYIASADAPIAPEQQKLLSQIARMLELNPVEYSKLYDKYSRPLEAHHVLGVAKRSPREIIKKRYYALMQRYHPDKFAKDNPSPEVKMLLTLKSSEIAQAYSAMAKKAA